jgi:hypothetical protein
MRQTAQEIISIFYPRPAESKSSLSATAYALLKADTKPYSPAQAISVSAGGSCLRCQITEQDRQSIDAVYLNITPIKDDGSAIYGLNVPAKSHRRLLIGYCL